MAELEGTVIGGSMGHTTSLRQALRATFIPHVKKLGFSIDQRHAPAFTTFRRARGDRVQFLELAWARSGAPTFRVRFGAVSASIVNRTGQRVPVSDVGPDQTPSYVQLIPSGIGRGLSRDFSLRRPPLLALLALQRHKPPEAVCRELLDLFGEVEAYFDRDVLGPHCRLVRNTDLESASHRHATDDRLGRSPA